jgi:hypothetical protein
MVGQGSTSTADVCLESMCNDAIRVSVCYVCKAYSTAARVIRHHDLLVKCAHNKILVIFEGTKQLKSGIT